MRLWHKDLIHYLPRQQLVGQWRELCLILKNIHEKGTPNHVLVNRVMEYPRSHLWTYVDAIYAEMTARGYRCGYYRVENYRPLFLDNESIDEIFPDWHNDRYLRQCLYNLQEKADCGAVPPEEWKRIENHFKEYLK